MKICISCSMGGHLVEVLQLKNVYKKYNYFYLTFYKKGLVDEIKGEKIYFVENPGRSIIKLLKNIIQTFFVLKKEKPDIIISTGAGSAVPSIIIGKLLFNAKIIFIESFARINTKSLSGIISYPFSDLFLVQWRNMLKLYGKKALYRGAVY
ncbi:MAG: UDP-N-acetylglucosamine transferase subunit ALG14 [Candidatus Aenigmarchaeota archaeon]|nr:UDP-N-acetylglucosamine transferase subunit ALG14 [Candidatus Aenigmarchaeota archaeon]